MTIVIKVVIIKEVLASFPWVHSTYNPAAQSTNTFSQEMQQPGRSGNGKWLELIYVVPYQVHMGPKVLYTSPRRTMMVGSDSHSCPGEH